MIVQSFLSRHPGRRINDYRNSTPRYVKVLGVGETAKTIVEQFNDENRENVLTSGQINPMRLEPMDEPVDGMRPNAVIVVYQNGEQAKFPFLVERTASMLSLIVLDPPGSKADSDASRKIREIQSVADLYVTTSDQDFVAELVNNLAS